MDDSVSHELLRLSSLAHSNKHVAARHDAPDRHHETRKPFSSKQPLPSVPTRSAASHAHLLFAWTSAASSWHPSEVCCVSCTACCAPFSSSCVGAHLLRCGAGLTRHRDPNRRHWAGPSSTSDGDTWEPMQHQQTERCESKNKARRGWGAPVLETRCAEDHNRTEQSSAVCVRFRRPSGTFSSPRVVHVTLLSKGNPTISGSS